MPRLDRPTTLACSFILAALGACTTGDDTAGATSGVTGGEAPCVDGDACGKGGVCLDGQCVVPSAEQEAQASLVREYVAGVEKATAYALPLDFAAIAEAGARNVLRGDGSEARVQRELRRAHLAIPQGHQDLMFTKCGQTPANVPYASSSWYGVCGRPNGDSVVVTSARAGNRLGLAPGDRVVAVTQAGESWKSPGLLERIALEPVCGSSSPSRSHREEWAAASLFGVVREGSRLTVLDPSGKEREVTVGAPDATSTWCSSPFGGLETFAAKATLRDDGIGVVRVPGFATMDHPLPEPLTPASYEQWVGEHVALIQAEFDKVKTARGIVWDVRSSYGGSPEVGFAIAGGMPGAKSGRVADCFLRTPGPPPFAYSPAPASSLSMTTGGPLAYSGKVAVLVDGMTYSAGDYFAHVVHDRTDAVLVGRPNAGAYGRGGNPLVVVNGPPKFGYTVDRVKCVDAEGKPLETRTFEPDLRVEYDPKDLAAGIDTVLERAVSAVK